MLVIALERLVKEVVDGLRFVGINVTPATNLRTPTVRQTSCSTGLEV